MPLAVSDKCNQGVAAPFAAAEFPVDDSYEESDKINVLPFIETADIVCPGRFSVMENQVYGN